MGKRLENLIFHAFTVNKSPSPAVPKKGMNYEHVALCVTILAALMYPNARK
jgi:hypothetical protein